MWPFSGKGDRKPSHLPSALGRRGEKIASKHLRKLGMKILGMNYTCPAGEADIVALDRKSDIIVIAEVKTRSSDSFTSPVSAVDYEKRNRLRRIADYYISTHSTNKLNVRFDVISIVIPPGNKPELEYIPNAFS